MTHPDQDIIDFLTKGLNLGVAPGWMIERARAFRDGGWRRIEDAICDDRFVEAWDAERGLVLAPYDLDHDSNPSWHKERGITHVRPLPNPPKDTEQ